MKTPKSMTNLINHFERLPGIGPKTAQRLVFYLMRFPEQEIAKFASDMIKFKTNTRLCEICNNITETSVCEICESSDRESNQLMVVTTPMDVFAMEKTNYNGVYHVLHGVIDPLNNIGPDEIFLENLFSRLDELKNRGSLEFEQLEIILALSSSMEGEATCMYISNKIKQKGFTDIEVKITRIARGIPVGGDVEYADDITLRRALEGRQPIE